MSVKEVTTDDGLAFSIVISSKSTAREVLHNVAIARRSLYPDAPAVEDVVNKCCVAVELNEKKGSFTIVPRDENIPNLNSRSAKVQILGFAHSIDDSSRRREELINLSSLLMLLASSSSTSIPLVGIGSTGLALASRILEPHETHIAVSVSSSSSNTTENKERLWASPLEVSSSSNSGNNNRDNARITAAISEPPKATAVKSAGIAAAGKKSASIGHELSKTTSAKLVTASAVEILATNDDGDQRQEKIGAVGQATLLRALKTAVPIAVDALAPTQQKAVGPPPDALLSNVSRKSPADNRPDPATSLVANSNTSKPINADSEDDDESDDQKPLSKKGVVSTSLISMKHAGSESEDDESEDNDESEDQKSFSKKSEVHSSGRSVDWPSRPTEDSNRSESDDDDDPEEEDAGDQGDGGKNTERPALLVSYTTSGLRFPAHGASRRSSSSSSDSGATKKQLPQKMTLSGERKAKVITRDESDDTDDDSDVDMPRKKAEKPVDSSKAPVGLTSLLIRPPVSKSPSHFLPKSNSSSKSALIMKAPALSRPSVLEPSRHLTQSAVETAPAGVQIARGAPQQAEPSQSPAENSSKASRRMRRVAAKSAATSEVQGNAVLPTKPIPLPKPAKTTMAVATTTGVKNIPAASALVTAKDTNNRAMAAAAPQYKMSSAVEMSKQRAAAAAEATTASAPAAPTVSTSATGRGVDDAGDGGTLHLSTGSSSSSILTTTAKGRKTRDTTSSSSDKLKSRSNLPQVYRQGVLVSSAVDQPLGDDVSGKRRSLTESSNGQPGAKRAKKTGGATTQPVQTNGGLGA